MKIDQDNQFSCTSDHLVPKIKYLVFYFFNYLSLCVTITLLTVEYCLATTNRFRRLFIRNEFLYLCHLIDRTKFQKNLDNV